MLSPTSEAAYAASQRSTLPSRYAGLPAGPASPVSSSTGSTRDSDIAGKTSQGRNGKPNIWTETCSRPSVSPAASAARPRSR
ncbi:hypothetical protein SSPIM334S_04287 [Streptomyces spiroverticillatus]